METSGHQVGDNVCRQVSDTSQVRPFYIRFLVNNSYLVDLRTALITLVQINISCCNCTYASDYHKVKNTKLMLGAVMGVVHKQHNYYSSIVCLRISQRLVLSKICDPLWEKGYFRAKIRNCVTHTIRKRYACCIRWRKPHVRRPFRSSTIRLNVRTLTRALFRDIARGISITQYKRRRRRQLGRDAASVRSGKSTPLQREKIDAKAWFSPVTKSRITKSVEFLAICACGENFIFARKYPFSQSGSHMHRTDVWGYILPLFLCYYYELLGYFKAKSFN